MGFSNEDWIKGGMVFDEFVDYNTLNLKPLYNTIADKKQPFDHQMNIYMHVKVFTNIWQTIKCV